MKRGKKGEVRIKLENILKKYGIDRPTYHSGDLTGVKVKVLLQNIDVIFGEEFRTVLIDAAEDSDVDEEEIKKVVDMYTHLGFLLDGIFSFARTKCGKLTNEIIDLTKRMITAALHLW